MIFCLSEVFQYGAFPHQSVSPNLEPKTRTASASFLALLFTSICTIGIDKSESSVKTPLAAQLVTTGVFNNSDIVFNSSNACE